MNEPLTDLNKYNPDGSSLKYNIDNTITVTTAYGYQYYISSDGQTTLYQYPDGTLHSQPWYSLGTNVNPCINSDSDTSSSTSDNDGNSSASYSDSENPYFEPDNSHDVDPKFLFDSYFATMHQLYKTREEVIRGSLQYVSAVIPSDYWAITSEELSDPNAKINLFISELQKLSTSELSRAEILLLNHLQTSLTIHNSLKLYQAHITIDNVTAILDLYDDTFIQYTKQNQNDAPH